MKTVYTVLLLVLFSSPALAIIFPAPDFCVQTGSAANGGQPIPQWKAGDNAFNDWHIDVEQNDTKTFHVRAREAGNYLYDMKFSLGSTPAQYPAGRTNCDPPTTNPFSSETPCAGHYPTPIPSIF